MSKRRFTMSEVASVIESRIAITLLSSDVPREEFQRLVHEIYDALEALPVPKEDELGCPCFHVTPCSMHCSCANSIMSGGCQRCCAYGSRGQQMASAQQLAKIIDSAAPSSPAPEETERERRNVWAVQYPDGTYVRFMGRIKRYESQEQAIRDDPGRSLSDLTPLTVIYRERRHA